MTWTVTAQDLDAFEHVNNIAYITWCETIAWKHSKSNGLGLAQFRENDCALVVHKHEFDYLAPAYLGDEISIDTWISHSDYKFSFWRQYRMRNQKGDLLLRGKTRWVSVSMATGKLTRMPEFYLEAYLVTETLVEDRFAIGSLAVDNLVPDGLVKDKNSSVTENSK